MQALTKQALVALLFAVGIQNTFALPAAVADVNDVALVEARNAFAEPKKGGSGGKNSGAPAVSSKPAATSAAPTSAASTSHTSAPSSSTPPSSGGSSHPAPTTGNTLAPSPSVTTTDTTSDAPSGAPSASKSGATSGASATGTVTSSAATSSGAACSRPTGSASAGAKPSKGLAARGDDQCTQGTKNDPFVRKFPADEDPGNGLQELLDADCYAHLCQSQPVLMARWDNQDEVRGKGGNGAVVNQIFTDQKRGTYGTTIPDVQINGQQVISPEEWCPASVQQSGKTSTLIPVTRAAQDRQKVLLNNKFYTQSGKQNIKPMDTKGKGQTDGTGSWFRIDEFTGAKGHYCKELNTQLQNYASNFDANGVIKKKPSICEGAEDKGGLQYDVGMYAYMRDSEVQDRYVYVGKKQARNQGS